MYYKLLLVSKEGVQRCFISILSGGFEKTSTEESAMKCFFLQKKKKKKRDFSHEFILQIFLELFRTKIQNTSELLKAFTELTDKTHSYYKSKLVFRFCNLVLLKRSFLHRSSHFELSLKTLNNYL